MYSSSTLLRPLLDDYFRDALYRHRVHVMEVECWRTTASSAMASVSSSGSKSFGRRGSMDGDNNVIPAPDVVIPFACFVEVGVRTNVSTRSSEDEVRTRRRGCGGGAVCAGEPVVAVW